MKLGEFKEKLKGVTGQRIFKQCHIDNCTNSPDYLFIPENDKLATILRVIYFICDECIETINNHNCKDEDCWRGEQAGTCKLLRESSHIYISCTVCGHVLTNAWCIEKDCTCSQCEKFHKEKG